VPHWRRLKGNGTQRLLQAIRTVARAPQFRLRVATSARARITVKTLPLGVFTQTSFALAVASAKGFRVTDYKTCTYAFGTFSNTDAVVEMELSADVTYTLIAATYDTTGRGKFQVDVVDAYIRPSIDSLRAAVSARAFDFRAECCC